MASTESPLVWEFYRQAESAAGLAGVVHYYDEESQSLYLKDGGLATQVAEVEDGHWREATEETEIEITDDSFSNARLDHPSNGILYGSATDGTNLIFLRYVYARDISANMESWSWVSQNDSAITQFTGAMQNLGPDVFNFEATLFQPGAKISLKISIGNSSWYQIGVSWLDEFDYEITESTVDLSGRNSVGYFLKDQTFDDNYSFSGISSDIIIAILTYAGITKMKVQTLTDNVSFTFDPSDSILDGLNTILSAETTTSSELMLVELPDGTVCVGFDTWMVDYAPNSYYTFNEESDIFKRKTTKLSDSSYTAIRATGKDASDNNLTPVTVAVTNFKYWALGSHRTKHLTAPDGLTQSGLQAWAESQAESYQYIGIGEDFTGPFRPQLLCGDIAEIYDTGDTEGISLGLITEVHQTFSKSDGFKTNFSVDSGGIVTDGENYIVYSRAAEVSGFNRRQRIVDLIRYISK